MEPGKEENTPEPVNVYGLHKRQAEDEIMAILPEAVCLRLPWMYDFPWRGLKLSLIHIYQKIFQNFTDHLRYGEPLLATGEDGLRGVMIANGAYLSSWLKKKVDFPIDDERFAAMLEEKAAEERRAGK